MSDSLQPHGLKPTRLPCPWLPPRVHSNSYPLSRWCYLTISSSVNSFSSALNLSQHLVFPNESAFSILWQKHGRFSFSISPSSEYLRLISFRVDWFDLLVVQVILGIFSNTTFQKHKLSSAQHSLWSNTHHIHTYYWENNSFGYTDLCWQSVISAF